MNEVINNIKNTIEHVTENVFCFKSDVDMNALTKQIGASMAEAIGSDASKLKCKGIHIFYVDDTTGVLMSSGLFVKGFSPEEWDDKK